jgi:hypothetical protein
MFLVKTQNGYLLNAITETFTWEQLTYGKTSHDIHQEYLSSIKCPRPFLAYWHSECSQRFSITFHQEFSSLNTEMSTASLQPHKSTLLKSHVHYLTELTRRVHNKLDTTASISQATLIYHSWLMDILMFQVCRVTTRRSHNQPET